MHNSSIINETYDKFDSAVVKFRTRILAWHTSARKAMLDISGSHFEKRKNEIEHIASRDTPRSTSTNIALRLQSFKFQ